MRTGVYQVGGLCAGFRGVGEVVSGDVLFDDVVIVFDYQHKFPTCHMLIVSYN